METLVRHKACEVAIECRGPVSDGRDGRVLALRPCQAIHLK